MTQEKLDEIILHLKVIQNILLSNKACSECGKVISPAHQCANVFCPSIKKGAL